MRIAGRRRRRLSRTAGTGTWLAAVGPLSA